MTEEQTKQETAEITPAKKPYQKPTIRSVSLRPEEAVLGACKVASSAGPVGTCGVSCSNTGS